MIEAAKIVLSDEAKSTIEFVRRGDRIAIHEGVSREEFERLISSSLDVIDATISRALRKAKFTEDDINLVIRTGGSSQNPCFYRDVGAALWAKQSGGELGRGRHG